MFNSRNFSYWYRKKISNMLSISAKDKEEAIKIRSNILAYCRKQEIKISTHLEEGSPCLLYLYRKDNQGECTSSKFISGGSYEYGGYLMSDI